MKEGMATEKLHVISIVGNVATITRLQSITPQGKVRKNATTFEGCANCLKTVPHPGYQYGIFIYNDIASAYCCNCGAMRNEVVEEVKEEVGEVTEVVEEVTEEVKEKVVAVVERSQTSGCDPDYAGSNPVSHPKHTTMSEADLVAQLSGALR